MEEARHPPTSRFTSQSIGHQSPHTRHSSIDPPPLPHTHTHTHTHKHTHTLRNTHTLTNTHTHSETHMPCFSIPNMNAALPVLFLLLSSHSVSSLLFLTLSLRRSVSWALS